MDNAVEIFLSALISYFVITDPVGVSLVFHGLTVERGGAYRRAMDDLRAGKDFDPHVMNEIFATSNRGLISGFLKGNPGHTAQNYEQGRSRATDYRFTGVVRAYDPRRKLMRVEARNPIQTGQTYELLTPSATQPFSVHHLFDTHHTPIAVRHGGNGDCLIPWDNDPGEFTLLRERLGE
jgi:putative protease